MKICSKCHQILPCDEFRRNRSTKDGYHNQCKTCLKLSQKAYYIRHHEEVLQRITAYNAAHREQNRQRQRTYYATHRKKYRQYFSSYRAAYREKIRQQGVIYNATHREYRRLYFNTYNAAHPERARIFSAIRRARIKNALIVESIDLEVLAVRDNWRCHICGKKVTRQNWSRDHLIPLSQGGSHTYQNIALCHRRCNSKRGAGRIPAQLRLLP